MKKGIALIMALMLMTVCACAELKEQQVEVTLDGQDLDVTVYSDGQALYVDIEQLMKALGGSCMINQGEIALSMTAEGITKEMREEPSVSWEYLNHWMYNQVGYENVEEWLDDCFGNNAEQRQLVTDLINKAIAKTKDVDAFVAAVSNVVFSGGYATTALEELVK